VNEPLPPKPQAKTASARAAESRAAKLAAGYASKTYLLPPAALAHLATLTARDDVAEAEAVTRALALAAEPGAPAAVGASSASPSWFVVEGWRHVARGWQCEGRAHPPQLAADIRAHAGATLTLNGESWAIRSAGPLPGALSDNAMADGAAFLITGAPPANACIIEGPK